MLELQWLKIDHAVLLHKRLPIVLSEAWHWHAAVVRHALHSISHDVEGMVSCPAESSCHPVVQTLA